MASLRSVWVVCVGVMVFGAAVFAGGKDGAAKPEPKKDLYHHLLSIKADSFEKQNSKEDLLRGFTTHSQPQGNQFVAYVVIRWGDLDNLVKERPKGYYRNWDGFLKVDGGAADVVGKLAFDDGADRSKAHPKVHPMPEKAAKTGPHEGSGRDALVEDNDPAKVTWDAGVVGATDGLVIKLTLKAATATGTVKAGSFTIPFSISPAETTVK